MPPNVLLLVLDAARADHFEPYGAPIGSSPVIAEMARDGGVVPHAYTTACWTIPAHAALFTGLLPRAAGLIRVPGGTGNVAACREPLENLRDRLLAEVMRQAGYETRAVTTNAWLRPGSGFETGFERYELIGPSRNMAVADTGRRADLIATWEAIRAQADDGARASGNLIHEWIRESRDRPFFWFVNLVEAHSPYLPPLPYNELSVANRIRAAAEARRYLTLEANWRVCAGHLTVPPDVLARMRMLYRNAIRSLDNWVGGVLESLSAAGLLDDTLVIVTADHGENLGESGLLGHAFSLDERLVRVPLVSLGPGAIRENLLSLASLPAQIATAAGIDPHPWGDIHEPDGVAIAQFDPPTGPDDPRLLEVLRRWGAGEDARSMMTTPLTAASDGAWKLLRRDGTPTMFDLAADPLETAPISPSEPQAAEPFRRLSAALERVELQPSPAKAVAPAASPEEADVPDLERRMRLLGYM